MCWVLELPIIWQCYSSHNAINLNEPVYMVNPSKLANTVPIPFARQATAATVCGSVTGSRPGKPLRPVSQPIVSIQSLTTTRNHSHWFQYSYLVVAAATPPYILPLGNCPLTIGKLGKISFERLVNQIRLFSFRTGCIKAQPVQSIVIGFREDEGSLTGGGRCFRLCRWYWGRGWGNLRECLRGTRGLWTTSTG